MRLFRFLVLLGLLLAPLSALAQNSNTFMRDSTGDQNQPIWNPLGHCNKNLPINTSASVDLTPNGPTISTQASAPKFHICSLLLISAAQQGISLAEGTGSVCGTNTVYLMGGSGGTMQVAANGGFVFASAFETVPVTTAGDHICLILSGSSNVSGSMEYGVW